MKIITESLRESGFELLNDGIRSNWMPDIQSTEDCVQFGKDFAARLK